MVAGAAQASLLKDLRQAVDAAITQGETLKEALMNPSWIHLGRWFQMRLYYLGGLFPTPLYLWSLNRLFWFRLR